jgi:hypothetical protein
MRNKAIVTLVTLGIVALIGAGCGDDTITNGDQVKPFDRIHLDLYTVAPLGSGLNYELWVAPPPVALAASTDDWVSLAKFKVVPQGEAFVMTEVDGTPIANNDLIDLGVELKDYDSLFITVEPADDSDPLPSASVYLAGRFDFSQMTIIGLELPNSGLNDLDTTERSYSRRSSGRLAVCHGISSLVSGFLCMGSSRSKNRNCMSGYRNGSSGGYDR